MVKVYPAATAATAAIAVVSIIAREPGEYTPPTASPALATSALPAPASATFTSNTDVLPYWCEHSICARKYINCCEFIEQICWRACSCNCRGSPCLAGCENCGGCEGCGGCGGGGCGTC